MKIDNLRVQQDESFDLAATPTVPRGRYAAEEAAQEYATARFDELQRLQTIFKGHAQYGVLILLQGMDGAGKDETIQTVCSVFDPQICQARQFKAPSTTEAKHDFLWRAVQALPLRGQVAVFNRSYYEQVTSEQVYPDQLEQWGLPPEARKEVWRKRYDQINNFERHLVENGFPVIKLFLHISKETERQRLLERVEQPDQQGELSEADLQHHRDWDQYQESFQAMIRRTGTAWAPWYVVPSDRRWYTYAAVASILVHHFGELHNEFPPLDDEQRELLERAREELGGKG